MPVRVVGQFKMDHGILINYDLYFFLDAHKLSPESKINRRTKLLISERAINWAMNQILDSYYDVPQAESIFYSKLITYSEIFLRSGVPYPHNYFLETFKNKFEIKTLKEIRDKKLEKILDI